MPDKGWVRIYHPDHYDELPDPDNPDDAGKFSLVTAEAFEVTWVNRGWADLDEARAATDPEDMPKTAAARIQWIDQDPSLQLARARAALADEENRDNPRTTVVEHAEAVIEEHATSDEDQTTSDNTGSEE